MIGHGAVQLIYLNRIGFGASTAATFSALHQAMTAVLLLGSIFVVPCIGVERTLVVVSLMTGIGFVLFALGAHPSMHYLIWANIFFGPAGGSAFPLIRSITVGVIGDPELSGVALSLLGTYEQLAGGVGSFVLDTVMAVTATHLPNAASWTAFVTYLGCIALAFNILRVRSAAERTQEAELRPPAPIPEAGVPRSKPTFLS